MGGRKVVKSDKCMDVSQLLGARARAAPKSYAYWLWIGKLSPAVHSRWGRLGSDRVNSAIIVLEKWSLAPFAPRKRWCLVFDAPVHRPVERQNSTLGYPEYVW